MKEQLPGSHGLVIEVGARLRPCCDIRVEEPSFAALDPNVAFAYIYPPRPNALYLRTHEGDTRLYGLFNKIVMPRFAVLRNRRSAILAVCPLLAHTR